MGRLQALAIGNLVANTINCQKLGRVPGTNKGTKIALTISYNECNQQRLS